jgi:hypothetical protein
VINEDDLLSEIPPDLDWPSDHPATAGDDTFYACEIGTAIWEAYRLTRPDAPERPPEMWELWQDPKANQYFAHTSTCLNCLED